MNVVLHEMLEGFKEGALEALKPKVLELLNEARRYTMDGTVSVVVLGVINDIESFVEDFGDEGTTNIRGSQTRR